MQAFATNKPTHYLLERTFKILTVAFGAPTMCRTQIQLCYNRLSKAKQISIKMLVLDGRDHQQPMKTVYK